MGTKYSSNSASGFDATPPPDDGTVSEANKVKYSTVKDKLATPVKNLADAINSDLTTHFDHGPTALTSNTTLGASHYEQFIQVSGASVTLTLTDAATLGAGWNCHIFSTDSSNSTTIGRATGGDTINGSAANYTLAPRSAIKVFVNAAANGFEVRTLINPLGDNVIQSADAGATAGPLLILDRNSATPAASDVIGAIPFKGRDSGAGTDTYAQIQGEIVDPTATSEDGRLAIQSVIAGTLATRLYLGNGLYTVGGSDQGANTIQGFSGVYDGANRVYSAGNTVPEAGLTNLAVTEGKLAASAVAQAKLKTAIGEVSATSSTGSATTLPGGTYGFYPQVRENVGSTTAEVNIASGVSIGTTYVTNISLADSDAAGGDGIVYAQQRYISSSKPYFSFRVNDPVPIFAFALLDRTTTEVLSTYSAEDPPWAYNGPTLITPQGRLQKLAASRIPLALRSPNATDAQRAQLADALADLYAWLTDPANAGIISAEINRPATQAEKNADMALIPHPFPTYDPARHVIVLMNPTDDRNGRSLLMRHLILGDSISEMLHKNAFELSAESIPGLSLPTAVTAIRARLKNTR